MNIDKSTILETLRSLPHIVEEYFSNIPETSLDVRRREGAWTLREHLYHIVGVQEMLLGRLELMAKEENPVIKPYFPTKDAEQRNKFESVDEALQRYKDLRDAQLKIAESLSKRQLSNKATHGEYFQYGIGILLNHMIFHEYWHMYRIEELWLTKDEFLTELQ